MTEQLVRIPNLRGNLVTNELLSPAEQAAEKAILKVYQYLEAGCSFRLEAGAGAGKTYSLVQALRYLIKLHGRHLIRKQQRIACITYTNVARDEIESRIDGHPAVTVSTIHSFCWSLIKDFQPFLREALPGLGKWAERLSEVDGIGARTVEYALGYPAITDDEARLAHDDVIKLTAAIMAKPKFQQHFTSRFPILLIDEYQDTNQDFASALATHLMSDADGPMIGLFGDHWQKIYGDGCGLVEHESLQIIGKGANFRSAPAIVDVLNRLRPELPQEVSDPEAQGTVAAFHTNGWDGTRQTKSPWKGDLPEDVAHEQLESLIAHLKSTGWDFSSDRTKILMLTHNILAKEQGYANLASVFRYNDQFLKKENDYISFMVDTLEPLCDAFKQNRSGEMFGVLGRPAIRSRRDKGQWINFMGALIQARETGTVGNVIDVVKARQRRLLPSKVAQREREIEELDKNPGEEASSLNIVRDLRSVSYQEVRALAAFIDGHTPFSTKHGVKGAEFENVLVVLGRGWNFYNFGDMLEWSGTGVPTAKKKAFIRNRNLFYVVCSRPKKRLALLFTQELSTAALQTLGGWFGKDNVHSIA